MVTSTAVATPTAAGASYVAAKAAAEAWTLAVAEGFRGSSREPAREQHSAAVIFVVKGLVDAGMRSEVSPAGDSPATPTSTDLAAAAVGLFSRPAAELNGQRLLLSRGRRRHEATP